MKKLLLGKIVGFIIICFLAVFVSYIITYYASNKTNNDINLLVTFEDSKEFVVSNKDLINKDILDTYPYIFTIENKGNNKVNYSLIIESKSDISKNKLNYILYLNKKEVKKGCLDDLKNDILYTNSFNKHSKDEYKLYIYLNDSSNKSDYKYSIKVQENR